MADNFYGITDTGKMRDNNEDNFIAQTILKGKYITGCVIDGVGGYEGGEVASSLTRAAVLQTLKNIQGDITGVLKKALAEANHRIFEKKATTGENMQMACVVTLALADINDNKFYYAHVGDTRLYLFRDNSLVKVTHDHSFVGFLEDSGRLSEEAAMRHPRRNEINKALGFDDEKFSEDDYIETGESPFLPGDILLLCSDGLSDMLNSRTIIGILNSPRNIKEKSRELINAANIAGGKDNITVVLLQNNKSPLQQQATKPLPVKKNDTIMEVAATPEKKTGEEIYHKENRKRGSSFFIIFSLILLLILAWFIYNDYFKNRQYKAIMKPELPVVKNTQEQRLYDNINNNTSGELSLNDLFKETRSVILNDSMFINKDSIHIKGNGITLLADSGYAGPAIILSKKCKYILLDSLGFENFTTAIFVQNKALHLKNVRFKNCPVPVLYAMQLRDDQHITGNISDSSLLKIDSVKNIIEAK
jgi:serine/threonine protein phosphatase PrpC